MQDKEQAINHIRTLPHYVTLFLSLNVFYIFQSNLLRFTLSSTKVWCWNLTSKRRKKNLATIWLTGTEPLVGIDQRFISHLLKNGTTSFLTWVFGRVKSMTPYWWCEFRVFVHKDAIFNTQGTNNAKSGRIFKFHGGFYKLYLFHV